VKPLELAPEEVDRTSGRILRRLEDTPVVPFAALQYALGEVAPSKVRVEPRMLRQVLRQISRRTETQHGPFAVFEPIDSIYVEPRIAKTAAWHKALIAARSKADHLEALSKAVDARRTTSLAHVITAELELRDYQIEDFGAVSSPANGAVAWPSQDVVIGGLTPNGQRIRVLITNDVEWVYPDDVRIWKHLAAALEEQSLPMIIARKAHLGVFPVMKRVGGLANELHHLYVTADHIADAHRRGLQGWPPVRLTSEVRGHAALAKISDLLLERGREPGLNEALIRSGMELGLSDEANPGRLLDWVKRNDMRMHGLWVRQVRRWQHWDNAP
jgi:hypothetical protein